MPYRAGTYILISPKGTVFGLYSGVGPAKGVRTSCLKGIGAIYLVNADPSKPGPTLELVDRTP